MIRNTRSRLAHFVRMVLIGVGLVCLTACAPSAFLLPSCAEDRSNLNMAFYAFFAPVSASADPDPTTAAFHTHQGYEADLLTALEAMEGTDLSFTRTAIASWDDIWLLPILPQYDIAGGGITILDTRTRDAAGHQVVTFTSGHIAFRQSLLVRTEDVVRLNGYDTLTADVRVGVLANTTGEARLLQLTGLADTNGVLVAGISIDTPQGPVVTDGSADYFITSAQVTPELEGRLHLWPPGDTMPQIIYLGYATGEQEILDALRTGRIDAVARGEIGNQDAVSVSDQALAISVLDEAVEYGGFTLAVEDTELAACLNTRIDWLTDKRRIGYGDWRTDKTVFLRRAQIWNTVHNTLR